MVCVYIYIYIYIYILGFRGDKWTDSNLKQYFSFNLVKEKNI